MRCESKCDRHLLATHQQHHALMLQFCLKEGLALIEMVAKEMLTFAQLSGINQH